MKNVKTLLTKLNSLYPEHALFNDFVQSIGHDVKNATFGITNSTMTQKKPMVNCGQYLLDCGFCPNFDALIAAHQEEMLYKSVRDLLLWTTTFDFRPYYSVRLPAINAVFELRTQSKEDLILKIMAAFSRHSLNNTHELRIFESGSWLDVYFVKNTLHAAT